MDPFVAIIGGLVLFFLLAVLALGAWHPRRGSEIVGRSGQDYGAQAEIEEHDIDQMIDARNERRARAGKPPIGDELAEQARRPPEP
jgi:hypothetical protein